MPTLKEGILELGRGEAIVIVAKDTPQLLPSPDQPTAQELLEDLAKTTGPEVSLNPDPGTFISTYAQQINQTVEACMREGLIGTDEDGNQSVEKAVEILEEKFIEADQPFGLSKRGAIYIGDLLAEISMSPKYNPYR